MTRKISHRMGYRPTKERVLKDIKEILEEYPNLRSLTFDGESEIIIEVED